MRESITQPNKVAGLKNTLDRTKNSEEKLSLLNDLAIEIGSDNPDQALEYAKQGLVISLKVDNPLMKASILNTIGASYWFRGDMDEALEYILRALEVGTSSSYKPEIARSYTNIGNICFRHSNYDLALDYYKEAHINYELCEDQKGIAKILNNMGSVYSSKGDYEQALTHHIESLNIRESIKDLNGIAYTSSNLGNLYYYRKSYDKALNYYNRALEIYTKSKALRQKGNIYINIGSSYEKLGLYDKALRNFINSRRIFTKIGDNSAVAVAYKSTGDLLIERNELDSALKNFQKALSLLEGSEDIVKICQMHISLADVFLRKDKTEKAISLLQKNLSSIEHVGNKLVIMQTYDKLSEAYVKMDEYKNAYETYVDCNRLKDELFNEEKTKIIAEIEGKYEAEKKQKQIEVLTKEQSELKNSNEELDLFASKAAHDLREPLRMMNSFSGLLKKRLGDDLDEECQEYLGIIQDASERMNKLLTKLLEYAQIGAKSQKFTQVDLGAVLLQVKKNLRLILAENNTTIIAPSLPMLMGSHVGFIQIFQNLISNAIKFKKKDEDPLIRIDIVQGDDYYTFSIEDNGIGINPESQNKIFDLFFKSTSPSNKYGSSGLGLAICKRVVENMKGKIWLESTPNKNTIFYFSIPRKMYGSSVAL